MGIYFPNTHMHRDGERDRQDRFVHCKLTQIQIPDDISLNTFLAVVFYLFICLFDEDRKEE